MGGRIVRGWSWYRRADADPGRPLATEHDIIDALTRHCRIRDGVLVGIGDDAAVVAMPGTQVVAHDMLVEGVHFRRSTASPADIGHKALAVNLSDLAAMGAQPRAALVGLGVPTDLSLADVDQMYAAMDALGAEFDLTIVGGDVTTAPALTLAVTVLGAVADGVAPVLRSGARPGDVICATGAFGGAAAGLAVVEQQVDARLATPQLLTALHRPTPRVHAGKLLAAAGAHAMMDCSDGLTIDLGRMARASDATFSVDLSAIPIADGVIPVAAALGRPADVLAAGGGEDYELLVCLPADAVPAAQSALAQLSVTLTRIGIVAAGPAGLTTTRNGTPVRLAHTGWEHGTAN